MKNGIIKFLSSLLALCMVLGCLAALFTATSVSAAADENTEEEEDSKKKKGFDSEAFLKTSYANAEDKLKTMSLTTDTGLIDSFNNPVMTYEPYLKVGNMELYVQTETGEVAVKNTETGQVLFTNPYDTAPKQIDENGKAAENPRATAKSKLPETVSQLIITFEQISTGKRTTMNSFTDAAANNQIRVNRIKNGAAVEYTMGTVEERRLVPIYIEKYRFEHLILSKIKEKGKTYEYNKMLNYYANLILSNGEDGTPVSASVRSSYETKYPALQTYGTDEDRKLFVSEDYVEADAAEYEKKREEDVKLREEYERQKIRGELPEGAPSYYIPYFGIPYTGYMSMYVYGNATNREMIEIEGWIRKYVPEYTFEELEYDHKLTGYIQENKVLPSFKLALEYKLTDNGFDVRMPANSVMFDEDNFRLLSVSVLPYLGSGSDENEGYVFVPDGAGALIRFEDYIGTPVVFSTGSMYGPDYAYHTLPVDYSGHEEKMRIPVYGVVQTETKHYDLNDKGEIEEECTHRWVQAELTADCTKRINGGNVVYCAYCGKSYTKVVPYEHEWSDNNSNNKTIKKADCRHEGSAVLHCSKCKKFYEELKEKGFTDEQIEAQYGILTEYNVITPKGEHNFNDVHYVEIDGKCYEYTLCSTKYELRDDDGNIVYEVNEKGEYVPVMLQCGEMKRGGGVPENGLLETDHDFDPDSVIAYEKDGHCYIEQTCSNCGYTEVLVDEHRFSGESVEVYTENSCREMRVCDVCGYKDYTYIDHTFDESTLHYVSENGLCKSVMTCEKCGYEQVEYTEHRMKSESDPIYKDHRCYVECVCENCGDTYTVDIDHEFDGSGVCKNCGFTTPAEEGHTYEIAYVENGGVCYRTFICSDCGQEYGGGSERTAVEHIYETKSEGFVCSDEIRTYCECRNCGYIAGEVVVRNDSKAEHKFTRTVPEDAVCTEGYDEKYVCSICGEVNEAETKHIVGHVYSDPVRIADHLYEYTCKVCKHVHYGNAATEEEAEDQTAGDKPAGSEEPEDGDKEEDTKFDVKVTSGYMAVMTEGATLATLTAMTGGHDSKYCRAYMSVTPRPQDTYNLRDAISTGSDAEWTVVSKRKYTGNYALSVTMLQTVENGMEEKISSKLKSTPYDASYSGMAAIYRDYLYKEGVLNALKANAGGIPLYLEAFGAISASSTFLTIPTTEMKPLNTFENLKQVVDELNADGITNIDVRLTGFVNGGMSMEMPYKVKFESAVGGNDGYENFLEYAKEKNVGVYPDFDFVYMHRNGWFDGYSDGDHAVKTIDDRYIVKREYNPTLQIFSFTGLLAVSSSVYDYFFEAFSENYGKFDNTGVSVSTLGSDLNSDFDKEDPYNREDSREFTEKLLKNLQENYKSVMIDGGNGYALRYADHILNTSLTSSTYLRTSCTVPFMAMVLHGSKNYAGSATNMASSMNLELLHIIENGASPYFIIASDNTKYLKEDYNLSKYYSLDYSTWKEDLIEAYLKLNEVLGDLQSEKMVGHDFVEGVRIPDKDEAAYDKQTIIKTVKDAIAKYQKAVLRKQNAEGLFARKYTGAVKDMEDQITAIVGKYVWAKDNIEMESVDAVMSAEDQATVKDLLAKIKTINGKTSDQLYITLKGDIDTANEAFEKAKTAFDATMAEYAIFFDVDEADYLNPDAYNENSYKGIYFRDEASGKIEIATDGAVDANGNPIDSYYFVKDNSIVRITYENGVRIFLNYNDYDVVIKVDGENTRIDAYSYYRAEKGAN